MGRLVRERDRPRELIPETTIPATTIPGVDVPGAHEPAVTEPAVTEPGDTHLGVTAPLVCAAGDHDWRPSARQDSLFRFGAFRYVSRMHMTRGEYGSRTVPDNRSHG